MRQAPLTPEELARLPEFVAHWTRIGRSAQPVERGAAERAIAALYGWAGLPEPRILWAPCPMTALLSAILYRGSRYRGGGIAAQLDRLAQPALDMAVPPQAQPRLRLAVERVLEQALSLADTPKRGWGAGLAIDDARRAMLRRYAEAVSPPLRQSLSELLTEPVGRGVRPFRAPLLRALRAAEAGLGRHHSHPPCFGAPRWLGTAALLDFLSRVLPLPFDRRFLDTVERCGLFWSLDRLCLAAERPSYLNCDAAGQLHSEVGPSLAFPSGWSWWHWHGVRVARNVIEAPETIAVAAIHAAGPRARRIMLERYRAGEPVSGIAAYLRDSGARLVDYDPAFGTLWQIDADPSAPILMLEVENRSPDPDGHYRHFLLRVDPELRPLRRGGFRRWQSLTARNAVASTFGLLGAEYAPQIET